VRSVHIKVFRINSGKAQAKQFFRKKKHHIFAVKLNWRKNKNKPNVVFETRTC